MLSFSCVRWPRSRARAISEPMHSPSANTSVGSRAPCQIEGRASGCSALRVTPSEMPKKTMSAVPMPTRRCGVSAIRRPARCASSSVSSPKPRPAMVIGNDSPAPSNPTDAATSGSSIKRTSAPCPSSHTSTEPRQNTTQSTWRPYWYAQSRVSGTSGRPMPMPATSSASSAANRAVSGRFMSCRGYRRPRIRSRRPRRSP